MTFPTELTLRKGILAHFPIFMYILMLEEEMMTNESCTKRKSY